MSKDGKKLVNFTYQTVGCFGAGGLKTGVNYLGSLERHKLGTISVSSDGASRARTSLTELHDQRCQTTTTKTTVSGNFKTSGTAIGTITFTQSVSQKGGPADQAVRPGQGDLHRQGSQSSGGGISGGY